MLNLLWLWNKVQIVVVTQKTQQNLMKDATVLKFKDMKAYSKKEQYRIELTIAYS